MFLASRHGLRASVPRALHMEAIMKDERIVKLFAKAYDGGYAIGAFNINNMETIQGIVEAGKIEKVLIKEL